MLTKPELLTLIDDAASMRRRIERHNRTVIRGLVAGGTTQSPYMEELIVCASHIGVAMDLLKRSYRHYSSLRNDMAVAEGRTRVVALAPPVAVVRERPTWDAYA